VRLKGILFLVILSAIVIILGFIFSDKWLERRIEAIGTSLIGARVEIDNLDLSLIGLHVRWDSLQAANPNNTMRNIITTGPTEFDMQFAPLLRKKVIIDNIRMLNVSSGTQRTMDGAVEKKRRVKSQSPNIFSKTIERLRREASAAPVWNVDALANINLDSVLSMIKTFSPQKIDSLKIVLAETYDKWDSAFAQANWNDDFAYLGSRLNAIDPSSIKTLDGLQAAYATLEKVHTRIDSLGSYVSKTRTHLNSDLKETTRQAALVDDWIKTDYDNALALAKLPGLDKTSIARFLFGDRITTQTLTILGLLDRARRFSHQFASDKPKKQKPPRMKGQTIYFASKQRLPDFWIKNIELSGHSASGLHLTGQVRNIVSNQRLIGQPLTISINGKNSAGAVSNLEGELNHFGELPVEGFSVSTKNIPLKNIKLSDSKLLPGELVSGKGDLGVHFEAKGESLNASLDFAAAETSLMFESESSDPLQQTLRNILQNTKTIKIKTTLESSAERTRLVMTSNLDELFSQEIESIVGEQVNKVRTAIEDKVAREVSSVQKDFDAFVAAKSGFLEAEMAQYEEMLTAQYELIENKKKELEKRIEEEKKRLGTEVQEEAKKRLKGLFE